MVELKIDKEFQKLIPPLDGEEFEHLRENILKDGEIYEPIIAWNGIIVDGHHRYKILQEHPELKYRIEEKQFENRYEAMAWMCIHQLGRRNLSVCQKTYLTGERYKAEKMANGASDGFRGNQYTKSVSQSETVPNADPHKTAVKVAKEMGVSRATVFRAEKYAEGVNIAEEISPGIRQDIMSGEICPTQADVAAIATAAPEQRGEMVKRLREPRHLSEDEKQRRRNSRKFNMSIDALDATHTDMNRPPLTGKDMLRSIVADAELALLNINLYLDQFPDMLSDDTCFDKVKEVMSMLEAYACGIRNNRAILNMEDILIDPDVLPNVFFDQ